MLLWLITLRVQFIIRLKQFRVGVSLRTGSLFLAPEESVEGNIGRLADLESDSGNVSHGVTLTAKSRDQNLVVLLDEVEATVVGDEGGDLLAVLDELDSHALTDGRVGLLSLNTNLLQDNSLGVGSSSEGIGLPSCSQMSLLVVLVGPDLVHPVLHVFSSSPNSCWLTHCFFSCRSESSNISLV